MPNLFVQGLGDHLLSVGYHMGFTWVTARNRLGFRCGYIHLPTSHPWAGKEYDDIPADVHGGLTWSKQFDDGFWIGFDCGHSGDAPDPAFPCLWPFATFPETDTIKDQAYVENECRGLCEQAAIAAARAKAPKE